MKVQKANKLHEVTAESKERDIKPKKTKCKNSKSAM